MRSILAYVMAVALCLIMLSGDASARGFGGRGGFGGYRSGFGGVGVGAADVALGGADVRAARRAYRNDAGFYAGGWGVDESDDEDYDNGDNDNDD